MYQAHFGPESLWRKTATTRMKILSIGIDIGTTTTHMVLSRLTLANTAMASRLPENTISQREILYRSPVKFTPLTADGKIDADGVNTLLQAFYKEAAITPNMVQTGALIITGESARARNAKEVAEKIASLAGDFVVESAGPHLESALAARGSGAYNYGKRNGKTIVNIDIGGGTSNLALIKNGRIVKTACLNIGGRCLRLEGDLKIISMSPAGQKLRQITQSIEETADLMSDLLLHMLEPQNFPLSNPKKYEELFCSLLMTDNFCPADEHFEVDEYWFSGGVAQLMSLETGHANFDAAPFGDIGAIFARTLLKKAQYLSAPLVIAPEAITATVIGAGMHSLQVSGSTIEAAEDLLPLKNLRLLKVNLKENKKREQNWLKTEIAKQRQALNLQAPCALVLEGIEKEEISYRLLKELASQISGWQESIEEAEVARTCSGETPCVILAKEDIAMSLSQILKGMLRNKRIITVDSIDAGEGDYVDIGKPLMEGKDPTCTAIPVVIKTLLFNI